MEIFSKLRIYVLLFDIPEPWTISTNTEILNDVNVWINLKTCMHKQIYHKTIEVYMQDFGDNI